MDVQGRIKEIFETKEYGSNGFRKREMVVTTEEQYPQHIKIEFVQDKADLLDKFAVGQLVKIDINLRGREWVSPDGDTKYFNSLNGWRIEQIKTQTPEGNTPPPPPENLEPVSKNLEKDDKEEDDLPF